MFTYLLIFQHLPLHKRVMHLFLYQANRHTPSANIYSYNNRHRYKQGTIRGDFDLELLKRGIKGRYEILPHGKHEFQKALAEVELQEELYGHIIQIEEARNAIWFKLNYDQVGKNVTKYIGGWRDLDPKAIEADITEFKMLKTMQREHSAIVGALRSHDYNTKSFETKTLNANPYLDKLRQLNQESRAALVEVAPAIEAESQRIIKAITTVQDRVKAYLKEKKF